MPSTPSVTIRPNWYGWSYSPRALALQFRVSDVEMHKISLERSRSFVSIVDAVFEVQSESWATGKVLDGLTTALRDCLHPQTDGTPGVERAKPLAGNELRRAVAANIAAGDVKRDDGIRFRR